MVVLPALALPTCGDDPDRAPSPQQVTAAERVLLTRDDLPGWQATPAGEREVPESERQLARCLDRPDPTRIMVRRLWGDTYRRGQQQAAANVSILRRPADATEAVEALAAPGSDRCVAEQLAGSVRAGGAQVSAEDVKVERFEPGVPGTRGTGFHVTGKVRSGTAVVELTTDVVTLASGRLELNLVFVGVAEPVERATQQRVTSAVGERLREAAQA